MGWATHAIEELKKGQIITIRPRGNSMNGLISSGSLVEIRPVQEDDVISKNDIVLCKVNGKDYLHLVTATKGRTQYQIGNNHGRINGWISRKNIFGIYERTR